MKYWIGAIALLAVGFSFGQGDADLFRYSKIDLQGGARFEAMGGAFGALGADVSSSQINPAGFGRYSTTQVSSSFGLTNIKNDVLFQGNRSVSQKNLFKMNTLGVVLAFDKSAKNQGYVYSQFGFGYNKLQNFTNSYRYEGVQFESLLDDFAARANGTPDGDLYYTHPFSSFLAYWTFAINPSTNSNLPYQYVPELNNSGNQYHTRSIDTKGGINEYYFSYSANYMNVLYVGANVGIRTLRYDEKMNHREEVMDTVGNILRSFDYQYNLNTKGSGLNAKLGFIYLPKDNFRLGLAFHSSTYYDLTDNTSADMTSVFFNQTNTVPDSLKPIGKYNYRLRSAPKIVGSIAYVFGTRGCLNADLEFVNYRWANLRSTKDEENYQPYDFTSENEEAKKVLKSALNLRLGGELVINSLFFVRGGIRLSGRAYRKELNVDLGVDKSYSAGLGYKSGRLTVDVSYRLSQYRRSYVAFVGSVAEQNVTTNGFILSASYTID